MVPLLKAQAQIEREIAPLAASAISAVAAAGHILSEDIRPTINIPAVATSTVSGVAVRHADLTGAGHWIIPLENGRNTDSPPQSKLPQRKALRVAVGESLPEGADLVVAAELAQIKGDCLILEEKPRRWQNCRPLGADVQAGELLLKAGSRLKPADIGLLASLGLTTVQAIPSPKVALLSVGDGIVNPGQKADARSRYNANDAALAALLELDGVRQIHHNAPVKDDAAALHERLEDLIAKNDFVIVCGGVSKGLDDLTPSIISELGGETLLHDAAIEPCNGALLARFKHKSGETVILLAMPGSPVGVVVGYQLFARRIIARMKGGSYVPARTKAELAVGLEGLADRQRVVPVMLVEGVRGNRVGPASNNYSGSAVALKGAEGFVLVEPGEREVKAGATVIVEWI